MLNNEYINKYNDFMCSYNNINDKDKYFVNGRRKIVRKKSGLFNYP